MNNDSRKLWKIIGIITAIVLGLVFLPIGLTVLFVWLVTKSKLSKKAKGIVIAIIIFFGLIFTIGFYSTDSSKQSSKDDSTKVEEISQPKEEKKPETEEETINFETKEEYSNTLTKGETQVKQEGKDGKKKITYEVTYIDGKETNRKKVSEEVIEEPIDKIVAIGTYEAVVEQTTPVQESSDDSSSSSSYGSCGSKKTCSQMTTCDEAYYFLNTCGVSSLDKDGDGIPCESICQ